MVSHRVARTVVMAGVAAVIAWVAGPAVAAERHSGSVVSIDRQAQTLVVEELGVAGKPETLHVKVHPGTNVVVSERDPQAPDFQHEFIDKRIELDRSSPATS